MKRMLGNVKKEAIWMNMVFGRLLCNRVFVCVVGGGAAPSEPPLRLGEGHPSMNKKIEGMPTLFLNFLVACSKNPRTSWKI